MTSMKRVRYFVLVLLLASSVTVFINRTNLNIAIVPMTSHNIRGSNQTEEAIQYGCSAKEAVNSTPSSHRTQTGDNVPEQKQYDWDQVTQGKILGSFFYSYFLFMIPGGVLAEKFGSRWMIFTTLAGSALASSLVPLVTDYYYGILMLCRFLLGAFQSSFYPAAYGMVCAWFPQKERSFAFAMVDIGAILGAVITYTSAGTITNHWGWPFLFYLPGGMAFLMSFLFLFGTRSQPEQHPLIGEREVKKIRSQGPGGENNNIMMTPPSPPWLMILRNPAVLATMLFKFSSMTCFTFIYLELPKYLSEVVHESISDNGTINAVVNVICLFSMLGCGAVSETMIQKKWLTRTTTRKVFSLFVGLGCATCFSLIPVIGCRSIPLYFLFCMSSFFMGFYTGSDGPIVSEMTKYFPATLYALFNMIAMSTGFIVPYFVGLVLDSFEDPTAGWPVVFYSCAALSVVSNLIFIAFAEAERQDFDLGDEDQAIPTSLRRSFDFRGSFYALSSVT